MAAAAAAAAATTTVVIFPSPGVGHLTPLIQFSKKLLHFHNITSTFLIPTAAPLSAAEASLLAAVNHRLLPPADLSDLPPSTKIETRVFLTASRSVPALRRAVAAMNGAGDVVAAAVVDLLATDALEAAADLGIPAYIFFPSTAMALSLFLHLPELHEAVAGAFRDVTGKIGIPGSVAVDGGDLLDAVQDRGDEAYQLLLYHVRRYRMCDGIILNSFKELEFGPIQFLVESGNIDNIPTVWPIGPLVQTGSDLGSGSESDSECLRWLDGQPRNSVLYVSFGSGGSLSGRQMTELALGLEMSGRRFVWVVKCPNDAASNATYFGTDQNSDDPLGYLPRGFLDRTRGWGLVVPLWAPQGRILAHEAVGGFLTHCGWNSTLEAVVCGVPLIAWPLYAEQKMNAVMLVEEVKVAMRARAGENGLVGRDEVANVVKGLMEGEEGRKIRARMSELKNAAKNVLSENGSSTKSLLDLVEKWKIR